MEVEVAPGLHSLTILMVKPMEYTVYCENKKCDFTAVSRTRDGAKDQCFKHLREIISSEALTGGTKESTLEGPCDRYAILQNIIDPVTFITSVVTLTLGELTVSISVTRRATIVLLRHPRTLRLTLRVFPSLIRNLPTAYPRLMSGTDASAIAVRKRITDESRRTD